MKSTGDPVVNVDPSEYGDCVPKPFPGFGLNFKGNVYEEMFVSTIYDITKILQYYKNK